MQEPLCPPPPDGGPSEALFSNSATLAPVPVLVATPPPTRPDVPYVRCVNPRLPPAPRQELIKDLPDRDDLGAEDLGFDEDSRGSVGTSLQLLAVGPQNYVLDIHPEMTFFKAVYKRHTPFAQDTFDDEVDVRFGQTVRVELHRRGDVLGDCFLQVRLPNLGIAGGRWADAIGYVLFTRIRFVVDDTVVHDQERLWYDLSDRLFMPHGKLLGVDAMIGRGATLATNAEHTVIVPLKFAWCRQHYANPQFLPLAALATRTKYSVEFTFETLDKCVVLPPGTPLPPGTVRAVGSLLSDQVFLDQDEQRALMRAPTQMLIETAQDVDALSYQFDDNGSYDLLSTTLDLREFNLPVKLLAWVAYDETDPDRGVHFRYLDCVAQAGLLINSNERFVPRPGEYFGLVQTYQHCARCQSDLVGAYSFALDTSQRQPSGALNFAVLDKPALRVDLQNATAAPVKVKAFAMCYNWLTLENGSLSMRFSA